MSDTRRREEEAVLEAIEALASTEPFEDPPPSQETDSFLAALAALPYALEPVTPPPESRQRLLDRVRREGRVPQRASVHTFPPRTPVAPRRIPAWAAALAAGLTIGVIGLGISNARLSGSVESQQEEIAFLTRAMMVGHQEAETHAKNFLDLPVDPRLASIQIQRSKLFPMTAQDSGSWKDTARNAERAEGVVFVCAKHRRWSLRVSGLVPASGSQSYRLWFLTESGPIPISVLEVRRGKPVEVSADRMPPDTRGILISLESGPPFASPPERDSVVIEGREVLEV